MSKPKAPRWLTEAFRDGVDERESMFAFEEGSYGCWLAQFDPLKRPCTDKLERCHIIGRQRVEHALGALLAGREVDGPVEHSWFVYPNADPDLILLAAWDPRNARLGCEGHHRRFDSHLTPPVVVPYDALPDHVLEFAVDWGLELELERQCPKSSPSTREEAA